MSRLKLIFFRFLAWCSQKTGVDLKYFLYGGFWLSLGNVASSATTLLISIAFANLLSVETYGSYKYIFSIYSILTVFALPEMMTAATRAVAQGNEGLIRSARDTKFRWGLLGCLAAAFIGGYYFIHNRPDLGISILIIGILLPINEGMSIYDALFRGRKLFRSSATYFSIFQIATTVPVLTVLMFTKSLPWLIVTYIFSAMVTRGIFYFVSTKRYQPNQNLDDSSIAYGKHLSLIKGINTVAGNINQLFLFHFAGGSSLAMYSLAIAPIEQIRTVLASMDTLLLPKYAPDTWKIPLAKVFLKKILPFIILLLIGIGAYLLLAPVIFRWIFPKYLDAVPLTQIYSLSLIFTSIQIMLTSMLKAKKKLSALHILNVVDITATFAVLLPLVYFFQALGLIMGVIIVKIIEVAWMGYALFKVEPEKI